MRREQLDRWVPLVVTALVAIALVAVGLVVRPWDSDDDLPTSPFRERFDARSPAPPQPTGPKPSDDWEAAPPASLPEELGWEYVDAHGFRVTSIGRADTRHHGIDGVFVGGSIDGRASLGGYEPGGDFIALTEDDNGWPAGRAVVPEGGGFDAAVIETPDGPSPVWYSGDYALDLPELNGPRARGETGERPWQVVPIGNEEDDGYLMAVGLLGDHERPTLAAWGDMGPWERIDTTPRPLSVVPVAASTDTGLVAQASAGAIYVFVQSGDDVRGWVIGSFPADYDGSQDGGWHQVRFPAVDRITGAIHGIDEVWFAGHRALRPRLLHCVGGDACVAVPTPPARLDPQHPEVEVIRENEYGGPLVLALQARSGPEVWVRSGKGWRSFPAPAGRLTGGALVDDHVVLVVDDMLFSGRLPDGLVPEAG